MIRVNIMGGLGNLMFQYAHGRALSEEYNETLYINSHFMTLAGFGAGQIFYYNDQLKHFNLNPKVRFIPRFLGLIEGIIPMIEFLYYRKKDGGKYLKGQKAYKLLSSKGKFYTDDFGYVKHGICTKKKKEVIGYYASFKYFSNIQDKIRKEFKVITPPSKENRRMIKELSSCNAVCVHIRRGDYISNPKNNYLVVCNEDYYKKGIEYIAQHVKDPVFYIFSNNNKEIDWIKKNYHFDYPMHYIELNNPAYEELRLMYTCKHFVTSNSSFSWWASFICDNPDKIVVAPSKWDKISGKNNAIRDDMVIIDV